MSRIRNRSTALVRALIVLVALALYFTPLQFGTQGPELSRVHAQADAPVVLDSARIGGQVNDLLVEGRYAYATVADRIVVFDTEAPEGMDEVASFVPSGAYGSWLSSIHRSGPHLLVSDTGRLWRFRLPEPTRLEEVDQLEVVGAVAGIQDGIAYLEFRGHLNIVDLADPGPMIVLASHDLGESRGAVYANGRLVVLEGRFSDAMLRVIDASVPDALVEEASLPVSGTSRMLARGDTLYLESDGDCPARTCLHVLDLSEPANPRIVASVSSSLGSSAHIVGALWDRDLIVLYETKASTELEWIDVSDRLQPRSVSTLELEGVFGKILIAAVAEGAVVSSGAGFHLIDFSDPDAPEVTLTLPRLNRATKACPHGNAWVTFSRDGGGIWHLERESSPPLSVTGWGELPKPLWTPAFSPATACADGRAFSTSRVVEGVGSSATSLRQIHVVDFLDPDFPRASTVTLPQPTEILAMTHSGSGLITVQSFQRTDLPLELRTWNSDGDVPLSVRGNLQLETEPYPGFISAAADGSTVVVATDKRLHIVDISDPDRPRLKTRIDLGQIIFDVDVDGRLAAFVGERGLGVVDVAEGRALGFLQFERTTQRDHTLLSVEFDGSRAYVSGYRNTEITDSWYRGHAHLWTLDLRQPLLPRLVDETAVANGDELTLSPDGRYLAIAGSGGLSGGLTQIRLGIDPPEPLDEVWARAWLPRLGLQRP